LLTDSSAKTAATEVSTSSPSALIGGEHVSSNKSDKWKIESPLKWLLNSSSSMHQLYSSNNNHLSGGGNGSSSNRTSVSKFHHGSITPKKTDAPMLNLVYDSHIKQRHDFR
jgi:hypothetical protein